MRWNFDWGTLSEKVTRKNVNRFNDNVELILTYVDRKVMN
jgi:hypothetical protein